MSGTPCNLCGMTGQIDLCDELGRISTTVCYRCWGTDWIKDSTISFQTNHEKAMGAAVNAFNEYKKEKK